MAVTVLTSLDRNDLLELGVQREPSDQALALAPSSEGHFNRANALRASGRNAEAIDGYDRALALRPNFAEAHANRGLVLRDLGRHAEALASLDRALTRVQMVPGVCFDGVAHICYHHRRIWLLSCHQWTHMPDNMIDC